MANYDKEKFYWIKLSTNFMNSDVIDFIMTQQNGSDYLSLYLMLCLKTVNNGGRLCSVLNEAVIPYNEEKIQRECKYFTIDTIKVALNLYAQLGLIYVENNGIMRIADFDNLVGCQTVGANKKALQRSKKQGALLIESGQIDGQDSGQQADNTVDKVVDTKVDKCPPEIDIDIEIDNISKQASKKEKKYIKTTSACACVRESGNGFKTENYNAILDTYEQDGFITCKQERDAILEFIKYLSAKKQPLLNKRLEHILVELDLRYRTSQDKIKCINDAINGGFNKLVFE